MKNKQPKQITNLKKAWAWLGELFEAFDAVDVPHGTILTDGICYELEVATGEANLPLYSYPLGNMLAKRVDNETLRDMSRMMDDTMDLQDFLSDLGTYRIVGDSRMLGMGGNDYQTRALWCHLMAEVGDLPIFDRYGSPNSTESIIAVYGEPPADYIPCWG